MRQFLFIQFLLCIPTFVFSSNNKEKVAVPLQREQKVLIITPINNIKSNYYYDDLIAKEMGTSSDSVHFIFNKIITDHLQSYNSKVALSLPNTTQQGYQSLLESLEIKGEGESAKADLSVVSIDDYKEVLQNNDAEYALILNQHYLKRDSDPMITIFHIVSYSLLDANKNIVQEGAYYYSTMKLENAIKIKEKSKKMIHKLSNSIHKSIQQ